MDWYFLDLLRAQSHVQRTVDVGLKLRKALERGQDGQGRKHTVADVQAGTGPYRAEDSLRGIVSQAGMPATARGLSRTG